jgi:hypothetical protein
MQQKVQQLLNQMLRRFKSKLGCVSETINALKPHGNKKCWYLPVMVVQGP